MNSSTSILEDASGFLIPTPMAKSLKVQLEAWTHCGHTGGVIVGEARLGKTRAIRALGNQLTNRRGQPIHLFYTHYGFRDVETVRAVFAKIARALDYNVKRQTADVLLESIVIRLAEAALGNDTRQVILVIDEAQLLVPKQLNAIAEIYNELDSLNINGVFFFVANKDQFQPLAKALTRQENRYLLERFFTNLTYFYGIRSEAELADCLSGYDTLLVTDGGETATQFFCPALYDQGWQLNHIAPVYWAHFREQYGVPLQLTSLGMAQFVRITNLLVMDYLPLCEDKGDRPTLKACVIKSLAAAGIEPSLVRLIGGGHDD